MQKGSVYKRGQSWIIKYQANGKIRRESVGNIAVVTKTMARRVLNDKLRLIESGRYGLLDSNPIVDDFAKEYLDYLRDVKKIRSGDRSELALKHFTELYGARKLSEIKPSDIDDYKRLRANHVKDNTINRELTVIRAMFNYGKNRDRFYGDDPVSKTGMISVNDQIERILTIAEEARLLNNASEGLRPVIITALNTGMRQGEIRTLRWDNVDLVNGLITIHHTNTKSKKIKRIFINAKLKEVFRGLRLKSGGSDYVFNYLDTDGQVKPYLHHNSLSRAFEKACKRAGIEGLRFHDLRHTAATRMIERGVSIVAVSKILGHANIATTMRYAHPDDSLKKAVELLNDDFSESRGHIGQSD
jgi:integrase